MKNKNNIKLFITACLVFFSASYAFASSVSLDIASGPARGDGEISIKILMNSLVPVNAFEIELAYPEEYLSFIRASVANSAVSIWQSMPLKVENGKISLILTLRNI